MAGAGDVGTPAARSTDTSDDNGEPVDIDRKRVSQADQLDYMADMIDDLREMACGLEAHSLANLLGLIQHEAVRVAKERRQGTG